MVITGGGTGFANHTNMSSPPKTPRNTVAPSVNVADGQRKSKTDPHLPHERDEVPEKNAPATRAIIKQGHDDLASGQKDTDCRNKAADVIAGKSSPSTTRRKP